MPLWPAAGVGQLPDQLLCRALQQRQFGRFAQQGNAAVGQAAGNQNRELLRTGGEFGQLAFGQAAQFAGEAGARLGAGGQADAAFLGPAQLAFGGH